MVVKSPFPLLSGLLLINKPSGPTSYDMIRRLKRVVPGVKIGHCGTLDPLAEGLLIILLGRATKHQAALMALDKTYLCHIRFGVKTDSGDITGKEVARGCVPAPLTAEVLKPHLASFIGVQTQVPPMHSALKHKGQPLYKLARKGISVERKERTITVYSMELSGLLNDSDIQFRVRCSSGTYVRTLAEDLASQLGSYATMVHLVRESIGPYTVDQALLGDQLLSMGPQDLLLHVRDGLV